jgi:hypothetical protein
MAGTRKHLKARKQMDWRSILIRRKISGIAAGP